MKCLHVRNQKKSQIRKEIFLFSKTSISSLRPTLPPILWVRGLSVKLTAHLHLIPMLRMSGDIPAPPPTVCFHGVCREYFYLLTQYSVQH